MCQWHQTSASLKYAVFSWYPCFSISLFTGEKYFTFVHVRMNLQKGEVGGRWGEQG